jgi:branched-chain amino acid transport system permease protein
VFRANLKIVSSVLLPVILVGLGILLMGVTASSGYQVALLSSLCMNIITLAGLNFICGYGGQLALGQASFVGVGAYATVILAADYKLSSTAALLITPLITGLLALVVGIPSLRLKGLYFATATLAFGVIFHQILLQGGRFTGGPDGRVAVLKPLSFFGTEIISNGQKLFFNAGIALLALFIMGVLMKTWFGIGLQAAKVSEPASSSIGISVFRSRLAAFVLSGMFAGVAGSLFAFQTLYVSPSSFTLMISVDLFMVLFFGGLGTFIGPVFASIILYGFSRWLAAFPEIQPFLLAGVFLIALRSFPLGIGGYLKAFQHRRKMAKMQGAKS